MHLSRPIPSRRRLTAAALGALAALILALVVSPQPAGAATSRPTIVLVHGAFADASSWNGVSARLQRAGYPVLAPALPLRGVARGRGRRNGSSSASKSASGKKPAG